MTSGKWKLGLGLITIPVDSNKITFSIPWLRRIPTRFQVNFGVEHNLHNVCMKMLSANQHGFPRNLPA